MNKIIIEKNQYIPFDDNGAAFRVLSGSVLVYLSAYEKDEDYKRILACEAVRDDEIPGFDHKCFVNTPVFEGLGMHMQLASLNRAQIELIESTADIRNGLSRKLGITVPETEIDEGTWAEAIGDCYADEVITDMTALRMIEKNEASEDAHLTEEVSGYDFPGVFSGKNADESGKDEFYPVIARLCRDLKIRIATFNQIRKSKKGPLTVYDIAQASNFSCRDITLENNWQKKDIGSFLAFEKENGHPVAIFSRGYGKYEYLRSGMRKPEKLTGNIREELSEKAVMLYRPFPEKAIGAADLARYILEGMRPREVFFLVFLLAAEFLMGYLIPLLSQQVYDTFVPLSAVSGLFAFGVMIIAGQLTAVSVSVTKRFLNFRVFRRCEYDVQAATFDRLFSIRAGSIKDLESGEIIKKTFAAREVMRFLQDTTFLVVVTLFISFFYFSAMKQYSGVFSVVAVQLMSVYMIGALLCSWLYYRMSRMRRENLKKQNTVIYQLLNGIEKLISSNAAQRGFRRYYRIYARTMGMEYKMQYLLGLNAIWDILFTTGSTILLYGIFATGKIDISLGSFIAFTEIFAMIITCMKLLVSSSLSLCDVVPAYKDLMSLLKYPPEVTEQSEPVHSLKGKIDVYGLAFGYVPGVNIIENINLSIAPGEYIGIVGPSGSGKSTLLRLLLGFEKADRGKIYYDDRELDSLNKRELRKHFGVVLQKSEIIPGTIFDNICITKPDATIEEVEEAVRMAGLDKDLEKFPMGLGTGLNPVSGGVSGGQIQRIAIARALVSKPAVLFFDEATSALDNNTQKIVADSIERQPMTKIVIAHRLSTIMGCDRIIVLDKGHIAEMGSFDELMAKKGTFYQLAQRQMA